MTTYAIRSDRDRELACRALMSRQAPFTVAFTKGAPRSIDQNRLQRMWLLEAQAQGDQTAEEYRGYCKLHFGVPILRAENEQFREVYDRLIRPRDYQEKLELMSVPMDLPVTRIMTTRQKSAYLDAMHRFFVEQGFVLTDPNRA